MDPLPLREPLSVGTRLRHPKLRALYIELALRSEEKMRYNVRHAVVAELVDAPA